MTKILLAPACVVGASLAARRWGTRVGGLLGGLPVVGGPILFVLALIHGRSFGAGAATGSLLGLVALAGFVIVYGQVSLRVGPALSVVAGWAAFLLIVVLLTPLNVPRGIALFGLFGLFAVGSLLLPRVRRASGGRAVPARWDLPVRALAALALVLLLSAISGSLGPHLSGLLAPFPIITAVLAVFTHAGSGQGEVQTLLRGFLIGFYAYAVFCFAVAVALPVVPLGAAFAVASAASLATQLVVVAGVSRREPSIA